MPSLLRPFDCKDWNTIVDAIESDFWRHTPLRARISAALKEVTGAHFQESAEVRVWRSTGGVLLGYY